MLRTCAVPAFLLVLLAGCSAAPDATPPARSVRAPTSPDGERSEESAPEASRYPEVELRDEICGGPPVTMRASDPRTTRDTCAAGHGGPVEVTVQVPRTIAKNDPVAITWTTAGITGDASIGFVLVKDDKEVYGDPSHGGPIMLRSEPACGTTHATTTWDGHSVGGAPNDAPTMTIGGVEPGTYRIEARLYAAKDVPLVLGMGQSPDPAEAEPLAVVRSNPLRITGELDTRRAKETMLRAANRAVSDFMHDIRDESLFDRVKMRCDTFSGPDVPGIEGRYCATFDLLPPLSGTLTSCATVLMWTEGEAVGAPAYLPGVLDWPTARAKVGGDLTIGTDYAYHPEGNYWIFRRRNDDRVVRVAADGSTCDLPVGTDPKANAPCP